MLDMRNGSPLVDVIATREYEVDGKPAITIAIAKPVLEENGTWRCDYDFDGPNFQLRSRTYGVDAFQPLVHAIYALEMYLDTSDENVEGRLSWLEAKGMIGLPRLIVSVPPDVEQAEVP